MLSKWEQTSHKQVFCILEQDENIKLQVLGQCVSFLGHFQAKPASWKSLFSLKNDPRWTTNDLHTPKTISFIFSSCSGIQNTCLCEVCSHLLYNCSRNYIYNYMFLLLRFFTLEIFPILTRVARAFKNTMLNKSGYFRTPASMKKSTALDFWRKSEKPEMESYIIYHDFGKIQVKNTDSYWILPYIYMCRNIVKAHLQTWVNMSSTIT